MNTPRTTGSLHFRWWLIFALIVTNVVVITVSAYWLYQSRQQHELRARTLTQTIGLALDNDLSGSILKFDLTVTTLVDEMERQLSLHKKLDIDATTKFLNRHEGRLPEVDGLRVADRNGLVIAGKGVQINSRATWADRDFFKHFREHDDETLWITKPIIGRVAKQYIISFVKRYKYPDGRFAGVVAASVPLSHFTSVLSQFDLGPKGTLILRDSNHGLITRFPPIPDQTAGKIGDAGVSKAFRELVASGVPNSTYYITNSPDGFERILTFRRLERARMIAIVGTASDDYLATWKGEVIKSGALAAGFILFTGVLGFFLLRLLHRQSENAEQLNAIFELSPDGFVSFDEKHCVKYCSPAFTRMTGMKEEGVVGLDEAAFTESLASKCLPSGRFRGISSLLSDDQTEQESKPRRELIELSGPGDRVLEVVLRLSDTETVSRILYFRDVTHETEVDRMKSEFLSTAAHELRTPMASIYGFAEVLLMQEQDEETRRDLLSIIYRQSELMAHVINELLDIARIEARRGKDFVLETVAVEELVAASIVGYKYPTGRDAPVVTPPAARFGVSVDRSKLQQAITNLISNAYKYSPEGGTVGISFRASENGGRVGIEVRDHGIGMTPEQQARVCERFYRADTSGKILGTGLGMSIVKEIVELHGGQLEIASKVGAGTTVTLWLPASTAESAPT